MSSSSQNQINTKLVVLASLGGAVAGVALSYFLFASSNNKNNTNNNQNGSPSTSQQQQQEPKRVQPLHDVTTSTSTQTKTGETATATPLPLSPPTTTLPTPNKISTTAPASPSNNNNSNDDAQTATALLRYLSDLVHRAARESVAGSGLTSSATATTHAASHHPNHLDHLPHDISPSHPLARVAKAAAENLKMIVDNTTSHGNNTNNSKTSSAPPTWNGNTANSNMNKLFGNSATSFDEDETTTNVDDDSPSRQRKATTSPPKNSNIAAQLLHDKKIKKTLSFQIDTANNSNRNKSPQIGNNNKSRTTTVSSRSSSPPVSPQLLVDSQSTTKSGSFRYKNTRGGGGFEDHHDQENEELKKSLTNRSNNDNNNNETNNRQHQQLTQTLEQNRIVKRGIKRLREQAQVLLRSSVKKKNASKNDHETIINVYKYFALSIRSILRCASGDPVGVAQILAESLRGLLHADRCTVFVADEERKMITATIEKIAEEREQNQNRRSESKRTSESNLTTIALKYGEGFAGKCAQSKKPIIVNNAYENKNFYSNVDAISGYVTKTVLTVPLIFEGTLLGVVQLLNKLGNDDENENNNEENQQDSKETPHFGDEDLELFQAFLAVSGVVVRDALLQPEVHRLKVSNTMMSEVCSELVTANLHDQVNTATAVARGLRRSTPGATSCSVIKVDFVKSALEELEQERAMMTSHGAGGRGAGSGRGSPSSNQHDSRSISPTNNVQHHPLFTQQRQGKNETPIDDDHDVENNYRHHSQNPLMSASIATNKPSDLFVANNAFGGAADDENSNQEIEEDQSSNFNSQQNIISNLNSLSVKGKKEHRTSGDSTSLLLTGKPRSRRHSVTTANSLPYQEAPSANYEVIAKSVAGDGSFKNKKNNPFHQNHHHQQQNTPLYSNFIIEVLSGIVAGAVRPMYGGPITSSSSSSSSSAHLHHKQTSSKDFVYCFPIVPFEDELDGCWIVQLIIRANNSSSAKTSSSPSENIFGASTTSDNENEGETATKNQHDGDEYDDDDCLQASTTATTFCTPQADEVSTKFVLDAIEWLLPLSEAVARNSILLSSRDLQNEQFQRIGKILEKVASDHSRFSDPTKTLEYVAREIEGICCWQSNVFFFEAVSTSTQERLKMFPRLLPPPGVVAANISSPTGSATGGGMGSQTASNRSGTAPSSSVSGGRHDYHHHNHLGLHSQSHADLLLSGTINFGTTLNQFPGSTSGSFANINNQNNVSTSFGSFPTSSAHQQQHHQHQLQQQLQAAMELIEPVLLGDGVTGIGAATREPTYFAPGQVIEQHLVGEFGEYGKNHSNTSIAGSGDHSTNSNNNSVSFVLNNNNNSSNNNHLAQNTSSLSAVGGVSSPTSPSYTIINESTSALVIPLMHRSILLGAITILDPHPQLFAKFVPNEVTGVCREQTPEQWQIQMEMFDFLCSIARFALRAAGVVKEVIRESRNSVSAYRLEDEFARKKSLTTGNNNANLDGSKRGGSGGGGGSGTSSASSPIVTSPSSNAEKSKQQKSLSKTGSFHQNAASTSSSAFKLDEIQFFDSTSEFSDDDVEILPEGEEDGEGENNNNNSNQEQQQHSLLSVDSGSDNNKNKKKQHKTLSTVSSATITNINMTKKRRLLTIKTVRSAEVGQEFYDLALNSNSFPIWSFYDGEQPTAALPKLLVHLFKNLTIDDDDVDENENDKNNDDGGAQEKKDDDNNEETIQGRQTEKDALKLLNIDEDVLLLAIGHALSLYRDVPYHNVYHAFDVTQTCYRLLRISGLIRVFTPLERFALILSCVFHDIDHNGLNNNYHIKAETQIGMMGKLSGQRAVLELHHCQTAIRIINNAGLFAKTPDKDNVKKITRLLFSNILATDMASHKDIMTMVDDTLLDEDDEENIFDASNEAHRELAMRALLKMADISNPSKEFSTGRRWGLAVTEEFFKQGDVERNEGRDISPMCDREAKTDLAKSQIGFIQFMVKPYYSLCAKVFPPLQVIVDNLNSNLQRWQKVAAAYSSSTK